jgi:hypothetical protein
MNRKYDDLLYLPHHQSKKHPQMSLPDRAAQFSSFAALRGHEEAIQEKERYVARKVELSDEEKAVLNEQLLELQKADHPTVSVTYFIPDDRKSGGIYVTVTGMVQKIETEQKFIMLSDHFAIPLDDIIAITEDLFHKSNFS